MPVHHQFRRRQIGSGGCVAVYARAAGAARIGFSGQDDASLRRLDVRHVKSRTAVKRESMPAKIEVYLRFVAVVQSDMLIEDNRGVGGKSDGRYADHLMDAGNGHVVFQRSSVQDETVILKSIAAVEVEHAAGADGYLRAACAGRAARADRAGDERAAGNDRAAGVGLTRLRGGERPFARLLKLQRAGKRQRTVRHRLAPGDIDDELALARYRAGPLRVRKRQRVSAERDCSRDFNVPQPAPVAIRAQRAVYRKGRILQRSAGGCLHIDRAARNRHVRVGRRQCVLYDIAGDVLAQPVPGVCDRTIPRRARPLGCCNSVGICEELRRRVHRVVVRLHAVRRQHAVVHAYFVVASAPGIGARSVYSDHHAVGRIRNTACGRPGIEKRAVNIRRHFRAVPRHADMHPSSDNGFRHVFGRHDVSYGAGLGGPELYQSHFRGALTVRWLNLPAGAIGRTACHGSGAEHSQVVRRG